MVSPANASVFCVPSYCVLREQVSWPHACLVVSSEREGKTITAHRERNVEDKPFAVILEKHIWGVKTRHGAALSVRFCTT